MAVSGKSSAKAGTLIELTAKPDKGYEFDRWEVKKEMLQ